MNTFLPPMPAMRLPHLKRIVSGPATVFVPWLATLTMHADIVHALGGLGDRLGEHIRKLPAFIINEAQGDQVLHMAGNAYRAHAAIFSEYPEAANFAIDSILGVMEVAHTRVLQLGEPDLRLFNDLNYLAGRIGAPDTTSSRGEKLVRYNAIMDTLERGFNFTGSAGADVFWEIILQPETFALLDLPKTAQSVHSLLQLLDTALSWYKRPHNIVETYEASAHNALARFQPGQTPS